MFVEMTFLQRRRLRRAQQAAISGKEAPTMLVPLIIAMDQPRDPSRVSDAVHQVLDQHEAFRWYFPQLPDLSYEASVADEVQSEPELRLHQGSDETAVMDAVGELMQTRINLHQAPLLRSALLGSHGHCTHVLLLVEHLIFDAASGRIFAKDLQSAIKGELSVQSSTKPSLAKWADWQHSFLQSSEGRSSLHYWMNKLGPEGVFPALSLPAPELQVKKRAYTATETSISFDGSAFDAAARELRVSTFMVGLTAFARAWTILTGQAVATIHSPVENRPSEFSRRVIGWLAHSIVYRVHATPDAPISVDLPEVRAEVFESLRHQHIPMPMMLDSLSPEIATLPVRPPRLFFSYDRPPLRDQRIQDLHSWIPRHTEEGTEPGVSLSLSQQGNRVVISVTIDPNETEPSFADHLAALAASECQLFVEGSRRDMDLKARGVPMHD